MCNNNKNLKKREEIEQKYKWNIEAMYNDQAEWEKDYTSALAEASDFGKYSGHLGDGAATLAKALIEKDEIWRKIEKVYVYARMKKDEDNRVSNYQSMSDKCNGLIAQAAASMSFFTPELLDLPEEQILSYIEECPDLHVYSFAIKDTFRKKAHILSKSEENILAQMSEITSATNDIFSMLNNADIKFGKLVDEDGDEVELTQGNYISFLESHDRRVRKEAFELKYKAYINLINTIATTYNYNTKTDIVAARIRNYSSPLEAALSGDDIKEEVYTNLINSVNDYLPALHKYMDIRRKLLGIDELHMYDIYVPLVELPSTEISYEDGLNIMRDGLSVLGEDYIKNMNNGLAQGWIDVYENEGKTSGAYSFGSYDSFPYILLNYNNRLKDVFTIVHEMGHSMHSFYTRSSQPYIYGGHSIFTAEVASTVNENLLMKHMLKKENDKDMKKYLLNLHLEEFRTTLFRQTMFAEFELLAHQAVWEGEVLTAEWLCEKYGELNKKYFGPNVVCDNEINYEWARIPHFYNAFYVYKYATGYSAAAAISDKIINEGSSARDSYIDFLRTGESDYPIELLKIAGVDMGTKEPVIMAMEAFKALVDEFESLVLQQ